jgi:hypothetical protein
LQTRIAKVDLQIDCGALLSSSAFAADLCLSGPGLELKFLKDEFDAYHPGATPNDFANPMLPAIGKSQVEMIRDN